MKPPVYKKDYKKTYKKEYKKDYKLEYNKPEHVEQRDVNYHTQNKKSESLVPESIALTVGLFGLYSGYRNKEKLSSFFAPDMILDKKETKRLDTFFDHLTNIEENGVIQSYSSSVDRKSIIKSRSVNLHDRFTFDNKSILGSSIQRYNKDDRKAIAITVVDVIEHDLKQNGHVFTSQEKTFMNEIRTKISSSGQLSVDTVSDLIETFADNAGYEHQDYSRLVHNIHKSIDKTMATSNSPMLTKQYKSIVADRRFLSGGYTTDESYQYARALKNKLTHLADDMQQFGGRYKALSEKMTPMLESTTVGSTKRQGKMQRRFISGVNSVLSYLDENMSKNSDDLFNDVTFMSTIRGKTIRLENMHSYKPGKYGQSNSLVLDIVPEKVITDIDDIICRTDNFNKSDVVNTALKSLEKSAKTQKSYNAFQQTYDQSSDYFVRQYVDELIKLKKNGMINEKEIAALKKTFITKIIINRSTNLVGTKNISGNLENLVDIPTHNQVFAVEQKMAFYNSNGEYIRDIYYNVNEGMKLTDGALEPFDSERNIMRIAGRPYASQRISVSGHVESIITDQYGTKNSMTNRLSSTLQGYHEMPYRGLDQIDRLGHKSTKGDLYMINTVWDIFKAKYQIKNPMVKGIVSPHTLTNKERGFFKQMGRSLSDLDKIITKVREKGSESMLFLDTETFGLADPNLGENAKLLFDKKGNPIGYKGHMYSAGFHSVRVTRDSVDTTKLSDIPQLNKLLNTPGMVLKRDASGKVKAIQKKGLILVKEPLESVYEALTKGNKEEKIAAKQVLSKIQGIQPTEVMKDDRYFMTWLEIVLGKKRTTNLKIEGLELLKGPSVVKYKTVMDAISKIGKTHTIEAYNDMFDTKRLPVPMHDALGEIALMGKTKDGKWLTDMIGKKSLGQVQNWFGITNKEIEAEIIRSVGSSSTGSVLHESQFDSALTALAWKKAMQSRLKTFNDKPEMYLKFRELNELFSKTLTDIGDNKWVDTDITLLLKSIRDGDLGALFNDELLTNNALAMSLLPGSESSLAKGSYLSYNPEILQAIPGFESSGVHKQLYQRFNSRFLWKVGKTKNRLSKSIRIAEQLFTNDTYSDMLESYRVDLGFGFFNPIGKNHGAPQDSFISRQVLLATPPQTRMTTMEAMMEGGAGYIMKGKKSPVSGIFLFGKYDPRIHIPEGLIIDHGMDKTFKNAQESIKNNIREHSMLKGLINTYGEQGDSMDMIMQKAREQGADTRQIQNITDVKLRISNLRNQIDKEQLELKTYLNTNRLKNDLKLVENNKTRAKSNILKGSIITNIQWNDQGEISLIQHKTVDAMEKDGNLLSPIKIQGIGKHVLVDHHEGQSVYMDSLVHQVALNTKLGESGYILSTANHALEKKRYTQLYRSFLMTSSIHKVFNDGKVKTGALDSSLNKKFIEGVIKSKSHQEYLENMLPNSKIKLGNIFSERIRHEMGLISSDKMKYKDEMNNWILSVMKNGNALETSNIEDFMDVERDYFKFMKDVITESYMKSGLTFDKSKLSETLRTTDDVLKYINTWATTFSTDNIDYDSYKKMAKTKSASDLLDIFMNDHGTGDKIASIVTPMRVGLSNAQNESVEFIYDLFAETKILDNFNDINKIISPNSKSKILLRADKDYHFMKHLFKTGKLSDKEAGIKAKEFLLTHTKGLEVAKSYAAIGSGFDKRLGGVGLDRTKGISLGTGINLKQIAMYAAFQSEGKGKPIIDVTNKDDLIASIYSKWTSLRGEASNQMTGKFKAMPNVYEYSGVYYTKEQLETAFGKSLSQGDINDLIGDNKISKIATQTLLPVEMNSPHRSEFEELETMIKKLVNKDGDIVPILTYQKKVEGKDVSVAFQPMGKMGTVKFENGIKMSVINKDFYAAMDLISHINEYEKTGGEINENMISYIKQAKDRYVNTLNRTLTGKHSEANLLANLKYGKQSVAVGGEFSDVLATTHGHMLLGGMNTTDFISTLQASKKDTSALYKKKFTGRELKQIYKAFDTKNLDDIMFIQDPNLDVALSIASGGGDTFTFTQKGSNVSTSAVTFKDLTWYLKHGGEEGGPSAPVRAHDLYRPIQISNPVASNQLPIGLMIGEKYQKGGIHLDHYTRSVIKKDWDGDQVLVGLLGLLSGGDKTITREQYLGKMQESYKGKMDAVRSVLSRYDNDEQVIDGIKKITIDLDTIGGVGKEKDVEIVNVMTKLYKSVLGNKEGSLGEETIRKELKKRLKSGEMEEGMIDELKKVFPELMADNLLYDPSDGSYIEFISESLGDRKSDVAGIISNAEDINQAWMDAVMGKHDIPIGYSYSRAIIESAGEMLNEKELSQHNIVSRAIFAYEGAIKSVKGGGTEKSLRQELIDKDMDAIFRRVFPISNIKDQQKLKGVLRNAAGKYNYSTDMLDEQIFQNMKNIDILKHGILDIKKNSKMANIGHTIGNMFEDNMGKESKRKFGQFTPGSPTVNFFKNMSGKQMLAGSAIALIAAGVLANSSSADKWYGDAQGEEDDTSIRWTFQDRITTFWQRDLKTQETNADKMSKMLSLQQKQYITQQRDIKSQYEDHRIKNYSKKFLSIY